MKFNNHHDKILRQKKMITILKSNYLNEFFLIFFLVVFFNCEKKISETRYYPNYGVFNNRNKVIISLDTTKLNFKQLTNQIGSFHDGFGELALEFNEGNIKKIVTPFVYDGGHIKDRNVLIITPDSILKGNGYHISKLKEILKKHYTNNGVDFNYPETPYNNLVEISIDTNSSGKELKENLIRLTKTFDEIKNELQDSIQLYIYFDYLRQIIPPPPPNEN